MLNVRWPKVIDWYTAALFIVGSTIFVIYLLNWLELRLPGNDIVAIWKEGQRISQGVNPYERILPHTDMARDRYFPPYLPGFYLLVALSIELGLSNFQLFIFPWRIASTGLYLLIGYLLFFRCYKAGHTGLGLVLALVWLLNRWSLFLLVDGPIDTVPLALITLALLSPASSLRRALLFSLSLAFKQLGIFLLPLFIIDQLRGPRRIAGLLSLASFPLLVSLPFLIWNAEGFVKSLVIQVTRQHQGFPDSVTLILGMTTGWQARLPMLAIFLVIYYLFARRRISLVLSSCLVMAVFVAVNPTLLTHYIVWPLLLGLLATASARTIAAPTVPGSLAQKAT